MLGICITTKTKLHMLKYQAFQQNIKKEIPITSMACHMIYLSNLLAAKIDLSKSLILKD